MSTAGSAARQGRRSITPRTALFIAHDVPKLGAVAQQISRCRTGFFPEKCFQKQISSGCERSQGMHRYSCCALLVSAPSGFNLIPLRSLRSRSRPWRVEQPFASDRPLLAWELVAREATWQEQLGRRDSSAEAVSGVHNAGLKPVVGYSGHCGVLVTQRAFGLCCLIKGSQGL